jgi:hypothetical protein
MPAKRFWAMEGNITRIRAEESLRNMQSTAATQSNDALKKVTEALTLELDGVTRIKRKGVAKADPDAGDKLKRFMKM